MSSNEKYYSIFNCQNRTKKSKVSTTTIRNGMAKDNGDEAQVDRLQSKTDTAMSATLSKSPTPSSDQSGTVPTMF